MKKNGKESVLTAIFPKEPVALSVGSINVGQRVVENPLVEDKNERLTYKMHEDTDEVKVVVRKPRVMI